MSSWLKNRPLGSSFTKQRSRDSPPKDADPVACYDSFRKHWQQSHEIICQSLPPKNIPTQDDVLGVVNHVDQMMTLLLLELRDFSIQHKHQNLRLQQKDMIAAAQINTHCSPCLEHLLSENLLEKLYNWSTHTGRFGDAVRLEQIKLYELLVSHDSSLLAHEPVTRPLLRLLDECAGDIMPLEVQKELVVLLNYVCVALVQNSELLGLFFRPAATGKSRFIIFTLLIPYVHREGGIGNKARDAMLLCMTLSKKNDEIGNYIAEESHICSVLATCLSGLYSLLPRTLDIESEDWHRLTVDDINDLSALTQLMDVLEFCNVIAQVAHSKVQKQLLEFLYRGLLVPVIGPALLQTSVDELVAATAYFDLLLRSVTEPGLLKSLIKFLLEENFDDYRILDHMIRRISSKQSRLSIVTLALFETLVDLNCEDVMLELCLAALAPCSHVMLSQRKSLLRDLDPFGRCAEKFLSLTPSCCINVSTSLMAAAATVIAGGSSPSVSPNPIRRGMNSSDVFSAAAAANVQSSSFKNTKFPSTLSTETLYSNYFAYLRDARQKIAACQMACSSWSRKYEDEEEEEDDGLFDEDDTDNENGNYDDEYYEDDNVSSIGSGSRISPDKDVDEQLVRRLSGRSNDSAVRKNSTDEKVNRIIASFSEPKHTEKYSEPVKNFKLTPEEREKLEADIDELLSETFDDIKPCNGRTCADVKSPNAEESCATLNSLQLSLSGGESSGYESFAFKGSSESTPINDDFDDEASSISKTSPDQLYAASMRSELTLSESQRSTTSSQQQQSSDQATKQQQRRKQTQQRRRRLQRKNAVTREPAAAGSKQQDVAVDQQPPSVGVFLDVILRKLEVMTENSVYVNLHLTGLISRLAIYPQPLLQSFLLNHSLTFQPSIKTLFQVLASLKKVIDGYLAKQSEDTVNLLVEQARIFLISRENKLVNARKNVLEAAAQFPSPKKSYVGGDLVCSKATNTALVPMTRVLEPKRRSLTSSLTQMLFKKTSSSLDLHTIQNESFMSSDSFPYIAEEETRNGNVKYNHDLSTWENSSQISKVQNYVLCAVILDEWLKELAAITQEHTIISWFSAAAVNDSSN